MSVYLKVHDLAQCCDEYKKERPLEHVRKITQSAKQDKALGRPLQPINP